MLTYRFFAVCLLGLCFAIGCGGNQITLPENPAPPPSPEALQAVDTTITDGLDASQIGR